MARLNSYRQILPAMAYAAWLRLTVQFSRTLLGTAWLGCSTLLSLLVLGSIYGALTRVADWPAYWVYAGVGLLSWSTLSASIAASCTLMERARDRLLNQPLPLGVYVLEEWLTTGLGLLIALFMVLIVLGLGEPVVWLRLLQGGWLGLANLLLGCLWLSLLLSPLAAAIADLPQLMPILLQIGFLSSPILFYANSLGRLAWLTQLNPLYGWVRLARDPFLGSMHWGIQASVAGLQLLLVMVLLRWIDRQRMAVIRWL
jgi:lipopolysaccharide transport system permease protein